MVGCRHNLLHIPWDKLCCCLQAGFADAALDGVSNWFYATAELDALSVDTGFAGHAVADPSSRGAA